MSKEGVVLSFPTPENRFKQPSSQDPLEDIFSRFEPGIKNFDNVDYPVNILSSEIYSTNKDAAGNRVMQARLFLEGYDSRFGVRNPNPWNGTEETIAFASASSTIWEEGVSVQLEKTGFDYQLAKVNYVFGKRDEQVRQRVEKVYQDIGELREKRAEETIVFEESLSTAAD